MNTYIGIDLGTSSVKLLLLSEEGRILSRATAEYPIAYPKSGWSEQNPEDWYIGVVKGIKKLLLGQDKSLVKGISLGGQMHGLVILDKNDNVIRPCILWNDGRTQKQTDYLNNVVGREKLSRYTANIAFAGFTAPKILWVRENEPKNFAEIEKIMLPKDYIVYRLCGAFSTDYSDASGMLLLDVENRRWSKEMCDICGVSAAQLPALHESYEAVGTVKDDIAAEFGLPHGVVVCAGAGDNAAAAVGTGTVAPGNCNISLGTSGTVFLAGDRFAPSGNNALHSFCHANGKWHFMGCILSAASANQWWLEEILGTADYEEAEKGGALGENDVYFLPYLMGERCPHNDVNARGAFCGMRADTTRAQMCLAVLEGVAFALRDCIECAGEGGVSVARATVCGGGAKSAVWKRILANVLHAEILTPETEQGPAYGAAMLAMVGAGVYQTTEETARLVKIKERILPDRDTVAKYEKKYRTFRRFYPALKDIFKDL